MIRKTKLAMSLAIMCGLMNVGSVKAEESTPTDVVLNRPCGDIKYYGCEGEPEYTNNGVSLEDAISIEVGSRNYDIYRNLYVYEKLTDTEKKFYNEIDNMARKFINTNADTQYSYKGYKYMDGISYEGLSISRAQEILVLYEFQNPQYYFLANYWMWSNGQIYIGVYDDFINGTERAKATEQFFSKVDNVIAKVEDCSNEYEKAKSLHDEICIITEYDSDSNCNYNQSAWSTFMEGETVCAGYSKAYTLLANACGLETCGDTSNTPKYEHAWNRTYVDGNWYYVDCAWDDNRNGLNTIGYDYFLIGEQTLNSLDNSPTHVSENVTLMPQCPLDYSPTNTPSGDEPPVPHLEAMGIFVLQSDKTGVLAGITTNLYYNNDLEYSWYATKDNGESWELIKDWTLADEWLVWTPDNPGEYVIVGKVREKNSESILDSAINISYHPHIKGKCQMPYLGEGGGYLIGVESYDNPNQSYQYEMLILDCTLLAEGKDAWVYTTNKCGVTEGNALWTIWQPQYGYYWTLFRVFDSNSNLLDEACFGFVNAY